MNEILSNKILSNKNTGVVLKVMLKHCEFHISWNYKCKNKWQMKDRRIKYSGWYAHIFINIFIHAFKNERSEKNSDIETSRIFLYLIIYHHHYDTRGYIKRVVKVVISRIMNLSTCSRPTFNYRFRYKQCYSTYYWKVYR